MLSSSAIISPQKLNQDFLLPILNQPNLRPLGHPNHVNYQGEGLMDQQTPPGFSKSFPYFHIFQPACQQLGFFQSISPRDEALTLLPPPPISRGSSRLEYQSAGQRDHRSRLVMSTL